MTIKIASIKNKVDVEREGEWIDIPDWSGVSFEVRSNEYGPYKLALELLVQRFARKYRNKPVPAQERDSEVGKLVVDHILLDWKGFDQDYDKDFAIDLITSPEGRDFAKQVLWAAGQVGHVELEFVKESVKNFKTPSDMN